MTFFMHVLLNFENANPLGCSFGEFEDTDSLKLGLEPTFPTNQEIPSLINSADLVLITPITPPLTRTSNSTNNNTVRQLASGANPLHILMIQEAGTLPRIATPTGRDVQQGGKPIDEYE